MASDVENKVREIISEQLGVDPSEVKGDSRIVDDLGADSLDVVELIMALEEAYDMEIGDEEAEKLQTVREVVSYIESHRS